MDLNLGLIPAKDNNIKSIQNDHVPESERFWQKAAGLVDWFKAKSVSSSL